MSKARKSGRTRTRRREQEHVAQRKALEEARVTDAVPRSRRTRLMQLGIVFTVLAVAIVAISIATTGGGNTRKIANANANANANASASASTSASNEVSEAVAAVNAELTGIPQHGNVLGNPKAPVTLQYFGDLECPGCKEFTLNVLPTIIQKWVRPGQLRIEYRSIESATPDRRVFVAQQVAAYAAGMQNLAWYFIELFYHEQGEEDSGYVTEAYLQKLGEQVPGLNLHRWFRDASDPALENQLVSDNKAARRAGIVGTPSFLLGKIGGAMRKLAFRSLNEAIEEIEELLVSN